MLQWAVELPKSSVSTEAIFNVDAADSSEKRALSEAEEQQHTLLPDEQP
jgi:hypothetical protein